MFQIMFHVTPTENLPGILVKGLEPRIGPRSATAQEQHESVYLFPTLGDVEAAGNWLCDEFDDQTELVLLQVQVDHADVEAPHVEYEREVRATIPASRISVFGPI